MTGGKFSRRVSEVRPAPMGVADGATSGEAPEGAPLGGTNSEAMQRLQVGLFGIGSMILLIGLAGALGNQADLTEEGSVPEAAATTEPTEPSAQRDPLADAGIVPDIPSGPSPAATGNPTNRSPQSLENSEPTADVAPQN